MNENFRVLAVDDSSTGLLLIKQALSYEKYEVETALDAKKAMLILEEKEIGLILLDINMPGTDGIEFCSTLKASPQYQDIPIIFLTALRDTETLIKGFNAGAVDYVVKPVNLKELAMRVQTQKKIMEYKKTILELERKNTIAAMSITTSHELNQPLSSLKLNLYNLKEYLQKNNDLREFYQLAKMEEAILTIENILKKYRSKDNFSIENYSPKTKMVVFDEDKK